MVKIISVKEIYKFIEGADHKEKAFAFLNDSKAFKTDLTPDSSKPLVVHENHRQFTYVYEGGGFVYLNKNFSPIKSGDLIFIDKETVHSFVAVSSKLLLFHWHIASDEEISCDRKIVGEVTKEQIKGIKNEK